MPSSNYINVINQMCAVLAQESAEGDSLCFTTDRLGDRIQDVAKGSPDDLVWRALSYACNYCLGNRGPFVFGPYAPMFVFPQGDDQYNVFPTPLDRVGPDVLEIWADYAGAEELHPMPRARLADLLWVREHGDKKTWIKTAVEMFVEAAAIPEIEVSERGGMLARAVAIIKESNNQHKELQAEALTALAGLAREAIDSAEDLYGVTGRALFVLVDAEWPCETVLADAMQKYGVDPWRASDLRAAAIKATPDEASKRRLEAERVKAFEDAADLSTGLRRVTLLENARSVALSASDSSEVERLNGLIQRTDIEGEMKLIEASVVIDDEVIRDVIEPIVGDDTLSEALDRFARSLTPDLSDEVMQQRLSEMMEAGPLQALIGRMRLGPDGTVISLPSDSPERHAADIGQQKTQAITYQTGCLSPHVLHGLDDRYGMCSPNLVVCFSPVMPQDAVDTIVVNAQRA